MLIEQLFSKGLMTMGPSPHDGTRQVGVFPPDLIKNLTATRARELEKFRWITGDWTYENVVPATRLSPAYVDSGNQSFMICEMNHWVCAVLPGGRQLQQITFDPFSGQWIYALTRGSYGILRCAEGWQDNSIVFTGQMTMVGIDCEWRMTWTKHSDTQFTFVNEEKAEDGEWVYIDEWRFNRRASGS